MYTKKKFSFNKKDLKKLFPTRNLNFSIRKESFGILLYDKITKRKYFLNNTAKKIVNLCNGKRNLLDIFSKTYKSGDYSGNEFIDFIAFLKDLTCKNIININKLFSTKSNECNEPLTIYPYGLPDFTLPLDAPLQVYWEITYRCNLDCVHCYAKDRKLKRKELSTYDCMKAIDELAKLKTFEIIFSGGEPLIREDLTRLIKHTSLRGIAPFISTNGTLINLEKAKELKSAGLQAAQVSLDGAEAKTHDKFRRMPGAYKKTIRGIKNLVMAGIPVVIATIPRKDNLSEIPKILRLAKKLKVQGFRILECKPFGRGINMMKNMINFEEYKNLLKWINSERKKMKNEDFFLLLSESFAFLINPNFMRDSNTPLIDCPAGRTTCTLTPDGFLSPCSYFNFIDVTVGNIKDSSIKNIWMHAPFLKRLRNLDFSKKENNNEFCLRCKYNKKCGRGCRALAYAVTKDLKGLDPRCNVFKNDQKINQK